MAIFCANNTEIPATVTTGNTCNTKAETDTGKAQKPVAKAPIEPITIQEMCREMPHVFKVGGQKVGEKVQSYGEFLAEFLKQGGNHGN